MITPKVLIVSPSLALRGGVSEFCKLMLKYSQCQLTPFFLSSSNIENLKILKNLLFIYDTIRFTLKILIGSHDIIHLNPSLGKNAIRRDALFTWISKKFGKHVFVHWHGWNPDNEYLLKGRRLKFLQKTLFLADHIKFLSPKFDEIFREKGFKNNTSIGNTCIDDEIITTPNLKTYVHNSAIKILYLSSVTKNKGIYTALETFRYIKNEFPNAKFIIAGEGPELQKIKDEISGSGINGIEFLGYVVDAAKIRAYQESDIYIFPSFYEGMPTSIIEAMAFGLPIICSTAGAIPDFFINGQMGYMINMQNAELYAEAFRKLISDNSFRERISEFNKNFAKRNFLASETIGRIDKEYFSLIAYL